MKIACLIGSQLTGGAAKGALNFVRVVRNEGLKVDIVHNDIRNKNFEIYIGDKSTFLQKIQKNLDRLVTLKIFDKKSEIFSTALFSQKKSFKNFK